jgi:hypothetical protein
MRPRLDRNAASLPSYLLPTTITTTTLPDTPSYSIGTDGTSQTQSEDGHGNLADFGDVIDAATFEQVS